MIVDEQWDRIHRERGRAGTAARAAAATDDTERPGSSGSRCGEQSFRDVNCVPYVPIRDNPYSGAGILNFVFGEMWLRPGLGMKERDL